MSDNNIPIIEPTIDYTKVRPDYYSHLLHMLYSRGNVKLSMFVGATDSSEENNIVYKSLCRQHCLVAEQTRVDVRREAIRI